MIDIKLLRENPDLIRASQTGRGEDAGIVDRVLALDEKRRAAINEFEALRAEQNTLSKAVGSAKGDEKAALLENAKDLASKVKAADSKRAEIEAEANNHQYLLIHQQWKAPDFLDKLPRMFTILKKMACI